MKSTQWTQQDGATALATGVSCGIGEQLAGVMSPAMVAEQALEQLGRRPFVIPGAHNRALVFLLRLLPKTLAIRLAGDAMRRAMDG